MRRYAVCVLVAAIAVTSWVILRAMPRANSGDPSGSGPASLPLLQPPSLPVPSQVPAGRGYTFTALPGVVSAAMPASIPVYQVARVQPKRDMVCDLARSLGVDVSAERYASLPQVSSHRREYTTALGEVTPGGDGDVYITLSDDGNYMVNMTSQAPGQDSEACSDEEARTAADAFLAQSGLLPKDCTFTGVDPGEAVDYDAPNGSVAIRMIGKQVVYKRYLNGIEDGHFSVRVNGARKVYGILRNMRDLASMKRYPVLSKLEAVKALEAGEGMFVGPSGPSSGVAVIEHVNLVYYEAAPGWSVDTVQPVYSITGSIQGSTDGFLGLVPAVRPEYLAPISLPSQGDNSG